MSLTTSVMKVIVEESSTGKVLHSQPYSDFCKKPSLHFHVHNYGNTLIETLLSEELITLSENELIFKRLLTGNPHADATRMIGSIAEVLVVNYCNKYSEVNRYLGKIARNGKRISKTLDDYIAVATGSFTTKNLYPYYYNPNDTQRDIIWIDKYEQNNQLLSLNSNNQKDGNPAGIQVKASHDYRNVLSNIKQYHHPVLYFDLNNDYRLLYDTIKERNLAVKMIHPDDLHADLKNILIGYFDIIVALFNKEITLERLIKDSKYYGNSIQLSGIELSEVTNEPKLFISSVVNK